METGSYRFKVGEFECLAASDGGHTYTPPDFPPPGPLLFTNAPAEPLAETLRGHGVQLDVWPSWTSAYTCLLVNTGRNLVLVDTGAGNLAESTGKLVANLRSAGIAPGDIDTVINTHAHPDHLGGNTDAAGKPAFPAARYYIWKSEWEFWTSGEAAKALDDHSRPVLMGFADRNLAPLREHFEMVDSETEIVPGIRALAAPGHTPGHMALVISSRDERLLCISDVFLHPVHLDRLDWHSVFDINPGQLAATRRRILETAVPGKTLVMAFHFPFPGLGNIIAAGNAWKWQPVAASG